MNRQSLNHVLPLLDMPDVFSYVEPFGGSAAVLVNRYPSSLETFNDPDDNVVVFFRVLRESDDLKGMVSKLAKAKPPPNTLRRLKNEVAQAARFYQASSIHPDKGKHKVMSVVDRLRRVQVECISPRRCIRDFDTENTLFYVKPRSDDLRRARLLSLLLHKVKGKVAIHAGVDGTYDNLYGDWFRHERTPDDCVWTNYKPIATKSFFSS